MKRFFERLKNKCCRYRLQKYMTAEKRETSLSDNGAYPALCYAASKDERFFRDFKRNPIYNAILEHVSQNQGSEYLDVISSNSESIFTDSDWDNFLLNDSLGNPRTYNYSVNNRTRQCSPTTLRYVKVLQDILTLFDTKKIRKVGEIGVGYGGQCRILTSYIRSIENYSLIDLPEVLALSKKYIEKMNDKVPVSIGGGAFQKRLAS